MTLKSRLACWPALLLHSLLEFIPVVVTAEKNLTVREIVGKIARIKFRSEDTGFFLVELADGTAIRGESGDVELQQGATYRFLGKWEENHQYGWQFRAETLSPHFAADQASIVKYLAAFAARVGVATAERLWNAYGSDAVKMLREHPERVAKDGILNYPASVKAAESLTKASKTEATQLDLFSLLGGRGFPQKTIDRLIRKWGADAPSKLRHDPLSLITSRFPGVGFKLADKLYLELGLNPKRLKRQMLCAWHSIASNSDGHTWFPLRTARAAIINSCGAAGVDVDRAIQLGTRSKWLASFKDKQGVAWITEAGKAQSERDLAQKVYWLQSHETVLWPQEGFEGLSEHQRQQIIPILKSPIAVLAGTPGTGKTYSAAIILREIVKQCGRDGIAVCAPTGKAAVRISEAMSNYGLGLEATTIHRRLGIGIGGDGFTFQFSERNPLPYRVIVVDEASMLDTNLARCLFTACSVGTHILLIGDPYQLPPVGHGAVLRDLVKAGIPYALLSEVQRNAGRIVEACSSIKHGRKVKFTERFDESTGDNLRFIPTIGAEEQIEMIDLVAKSILKNAELDPIKDVQFLCALNDRSLASRKILNAKLQELFNPVIGVDKSLPQNKIFRRGDKVICLRNHFSKVLTVLEGEDARYVDAYVQPAEQPSPQGVFIANGDMGFVLAVDPLCAIVRFADPERTIKVSLSRTKKNTEDENPGDEQGLAGYFDLAYAITVHKSQGSEFPYVVLIVDDAASMVASREHHYTGISRAKRRCLVIGNPKTFDRQCGRIALDTRKTFLAEQIRNWLAMAEKKMTAPQK